MCVFVWNSPSANSQMAIIAAATDSDPNMRQACLSINTQSGSVCFHFKFRLLLKVEK